MCQCINSRPVSRWDGSSATGPRPRVLGHGSSPGRLSTRRRGARSPGWRSVRRPLLAYLGSLAMSRWGLSRRFCRGLDPVDGLHQPSATPLASLSRTETPGGWARTRRRRRFARRGARGRGGPVLVQHEAQLAVLPLARGPGERASSSPGARRPGRCRDRRAVLQALVIGMIGGDVHGITPSSPRRIPSRPSSRPSRRRGAGSRRNSR